MTLRKEDQTKAIILIVAVVGVVGFIVFQFIRGTAPTEEVANQISNSATVNATKETAGNLNDKAAQQASTVQSIGGKADAPAGAPAGAPTGAEVANKPKTGDIEVPVMYASNTGNPFRSVIPEAPPPTTKPTGPTKQSDGGSGRIRPIAPEGFGGGVTPPPLMLAPDIKVMGIVTGENQVAVVEVGGKTVVAHKGDQIAPMTRVAEIERFGIVIKFDKQLIKIPIL